MTEEEWSKRENSDGKLLLTRDEWLKKSGKCVSTGTNDYRGRDGHNSRDRSRLKRFNCGGFRHYAAKCRKPRRDKQQRGEANLTQLNDDDPALLIALCEYSADGVILLTEGKDSSDNKEIKENILYLDNGASNHMTGHREKFEI